MTGEVKSYNPSTRYGFITSDNVDFRFHHQDWGSHQGFIWCLASTSSEPAHLQKVYALVPLNKLSVVVVL